MRESNWARRAKIAHLKSDSLETKEYWLPDGGLNEPNIKRDLAPYSHRHFLAAVKHARDIPGKSPHEWATTLCSNEGYVEAIFLHRLVPRALEEVRMAKSEYNRLRGDSVDALRRKASVSQLDAIDKFVRIEKELRRVGVDLRVVEDA